jgi:hypothetical protein
MQLGSIKLLNVSAQALHKVKVTKRAPRRRNMQSVLALHKGRRVSLREVLHRLSPKCSLLKPGVRTYTACHA